MRGCRLVLVGLFASLLYCSFPAAARAQGLGYWHTSGNRVLDSADRPVRIAGINWYGFETAGGVANGLTTQDYKRVLQTVQNLGYNTVRIPFSNQMVERPSSGLRIGFFDSFGPINTELRGLNSLEVLDHIVSYAGSIGLRIILDDHRSEAGNGSESNGLWYTEAYPERVWMRDWQALAMRYRDNPTVIGFDLRNEPHNANSGGACWSCGGPRDWHLAAQRAGNAVLAINPHLLIFVEGTDAYGGSQYWWGGNLEGVAHAPVVLATAHQLVYSAHDYGPREHRQPWFDGATTLRSLSEVWTRHWAYISKRNIAPVWLGEFGTSNSDPDLQGTAPGSQGQWFSSLVEFLGQNPELHWTYWALNGEDGYGLLNPRYGPAPVNQLKRAKLARIQCPFAGLYALGASGSMGAAETGEVADNPLLVPAGSQPGAQTPPQTEQSLVQ